MTADPNEGNGRHTRPEKPQQQHYGPHICEAPVVWAGQELAEDLGITDAKDRDKLPRACQEYDRAWERRRVLPES